MSKRTPAISVLTANRLQDGVVVFLGSDGTWVESIDGAALARSQDEARVLEAHGARDAAANLVVEPYLAEVREAGGRLVPLRARERVRVDGPSILGDVPGYAAPSPRASPTSPRVPSARGEGHGGAVPPARGEGKPHTPTSAQDPAPNPLPASGERGSRVRGEREAEAA